MALRSTPQWQHLREALVRVFEQQGTPLFRTTDVHALYFQQGVCFALERVLNLPDALESSLKASDEHTTRTRSAHQQYAAQLTGALWGSPYWDLHRERSARHADGTVTVDGPG